MKKLIYISIFALSVLFSGCGEEFLNTNNLKEQNLDNYYSTPQQVEEALGGIYNAFFIPMPGSNLRGEPDLIANILSDDMLAGGGSDDQWIKDVENWEDPTEDSYIGVWKTYYSGIFRANYLIQRFDQADYGDDTDARNQALGEAHFMRAFYYFRLSQMFGELPIITDPEGDSNQARASIDDVYALIASDLKEAIEIMPHTPISAISASRHGHANLWSAEALMARVYLFYTGYSTNVLGNNKTELPGGITKAQVSTWIKDMIDNSGHSLVSDQRNLWPYAHTKDYGYTYGENEDLKWEGENNPEIVFAVKYGPFSNWSPSGRSYVNQLGLFFGVRGNSMVPFGQGWGWGTVSPDLFNSFDDNDSRKNGSILDITDPNEDALIYNGSKGFHETGYFNKKYANIQYDDGLGVAGMFYNLYGGQKHFILWNTPDQVLIRFADVLLMAAELGVDAQANLDAVRLRSGLTSVGVSLENIQKERRAELCFEGLRYYDLLRWGLAEQVLTAVNLTVNNEGSDAQFIGKYRPETKGVLPIPESQIRLSNGVLTQTPGW